MRQLSRFSQLAAAGAVLALLTLAAGAFAQGMGHDLGMKNGKMMDAHTSSVFHGVKVNHGTVTHSKKDGKTVLTLSDDFEMPNTPDPHWQVVDSQGHVYLLDRLTAKPSSMSPEMAMNMKGEMGMHKDEGMMEKKDRFNKSIVLPGYVKDVAKVQIWCAWAETLLGEASFQKPLK